MSARETPGPFHFPAIRRFIPSPTGRRCREAADEGQSPRPGPSLTRPSARPRRRGSPLSPRERVRKPQPCENETALAPERFGFVRRALPIPLLSPPSASLQFHWLLTTGHCPLFTCHSPFRDPPSMPSAELGITAARKKRIVGQAFQPDSEPCQAGKPDLVPCRGNINGLKSVGRDW